MRLALADPLAEDDRFVGAIRSAIADDTRKGVGHQVVVLRWRVILNQERASAFAAAKLCDQVVAWRIKQIVDAEPDQFGRSTRWT